MRPSSKGICFVLAIASPVFAVAPSELSFHRYDSGFGALVFLTSTPLDPGTFTALTPTCWVMDLPNTRYRGKASSLAASGLEIRVYQQTPTTVRLSVLLTEPNMSPWALTLNADRCYLLMGLSPTVPFAKISSPSLVEKPAYAPWHLTVENGFSPWAWERCTQIMAATHPTLPVTELGSRLSTRGKCVVQVPQLRGFALGSIEHQTLFYQEPHHDYGDVMSSIALTHPLLGPLHAYEGSALIYREGLDAPLVRCDSSWFLGLGLMAKQWFSTLTFDRYNDQTPGASYYSQTLRAGFRQDFSESTISLQGSLQRLDPVIRQPSSYRGALNASYDRYLGKTMSLGLQAYWGLYPIGAGANSRLDIGPTVRIRF